MNSRNDRRGQAVQVGAAILLAFIVLTIGMYQSQVVPSQNEQVEFDHNQQVQSDLVDARNGIVSVPGGNAGRSVAVKLGTRYPERTIFVNPGPASGSLRTTEPQNVTIANVNATGETGDFWDGTSRNYTTRHLEYQVDYARYQNAPRTVYENTVLVNHFDGRTIPKTDQVLIDGHTITLVTLHGKYQAGGTDAASIDVRALSTSSTVVPVTNESGENVTLTVPTELSKSTWETLLKDERDAGIVTNVDVSGGRAEITLARGDYHLRMATVGVGNATTDPPAAYLTDVSGDGETLRNGERQRLVVEVRDEDNNPVAGQVVHASASGPGTLESTSDKTGSDGRAAFVFDANASGSGTANVTATIATSPADYEKVTFGLQVTSGGGSGGSSAFDVNWTSAGGSPGLSCNANVSDCSFDAGIDSTATFTVEATPTADGATVTYAVNNTSTASVEPQTGTTSGTGTNATTLNATGNGTVSLFASGGGSGDRVTITVFNNTGGDTVAPNVTAFDVTNPNGNKIEITVETDEQLASINVTLKDDSGTRINTFDQISNFNGNCNGGTCTYTIRDKGKKNKRYIGTLRTAADAAGNDGASGQTDDVTIGGGKNKAPKAKFDARVADYDGDGEVEIVYDASASTDKDGNINLYEWDYDGDGIVENSTSDPIYVKEVSDPGSIQYGTVSLRVTDDDGATDTASKNNEPYEPQPVPGFELFGVVLAVLIGGWYRRRKRE